MKAYLLVFDGSQVSRETMTGVVDSIGDIENWYAFFGNVLCLASKKDVRFLSQQIREKLPEQRFIIAEVEAGRRAGWLPKSIWTFLNRPEPAGAKADA